MFFTVPHCITSHPIPSPHFYSIVPICQRSEGICRLQTTELNPIWLSGSVFGKFPKHTSYLIFTSSHFDCPLRVFTETFGKNCYLLPHNERSECVLAQRGLLGVFHTMGMTGVMTETQHWHDSSPVGHYGPNGNCKLHNQTLFCC
jgi:hypothetical protein